MHGHVSAPNGKKPQFLFELFNVFVSVAVLSAIYTIFERITVSLEYVLRLISIS
jgi:hypothetical protein